MFLIGRREGFITFSKNRFFGPGVDFGRVLAPKMSISGALGDHFGLKMGKSGPQKPTQKTMKKQTWGKRGQNRFQEAPRTFDLPDFGTWGPAGG